MYGSSNTTETAALTGLTPDTTYYFEIEATGSGGTTYGTVLSFTTTEAPTAATSAASAPRPPRRPSTARSTPRTPRRRSPSATAPQLADQLHAAAPSAVHGDHRRPAPRTRPRRRPSPGLAPDTTYYFQIEATNNGGTDLQHGAQLHDHDGGPGAATQATTSGIGTSGATLNGTVERRGHPRPRSPSATAPRAGSPTAPGHGHQRDRHQLTDHQRDQATSATLSGPDAQHHLLLPDRGVNSGGTIYGSVPASQPRWPADRHPRRPAAGTATGATLNGTVNAEDPSTTVTFCYSTSSALANCAGARSRACPAPTH